MNDDDFETVCSDGNKTLLHRRYDRQFFWKWRDEIFPTDPDESWNLVRFAAECQENGT
jgi:hypothetical protein